MEKSSPIILDDLASDKIPYRHPVTYGKVLDLYWLDSIAKHSIFVMISCLGISKWKETSSKKGNNSCKYRLQGENCFCGCLGIKSFFLLQGVSAHTHNS